MARYRGKYCEYRPQICVHGGLPFDARFACVGDGDDAAVGQMKGFVDPGEREREKKGERPNWEIGGRRAEILRVLGSVVSPPQVICTHENTGSEICTASER